MGDRSDTGTLQARDEAAAPIDEDLEGVLEDALDEATSPEEEGELEEVLGEEAEEPGTGETEAAIEAELESEDLTAINGESGGRGAVAAHWCASPGDRDRHAGRGDAAPGAAPGGRVRLFELLLDQAAPPNSPTTTIDSLTVRRLPVKSLSHSRRTAGVVAGLKVPGSPL